MPDAPQVSPSDAGRALASMRRDRRVRVPVSDPDSLREGMDGLEAAGRLVTLSDAAKMTGRSRTAIRRRCERHAQNPADPPWGALNSIMRDGRRMVPVSELERVFPGELEGNGRAERVRVAHPTSAVRALVEVVREQERELAEMRQICAVSDTTLADLRGDVARLERQRAELSERVLELEGRSRWRLFRRQA